MKLQSELTQAVVVHWQGGGGGYEGGACWRFGWVAGGGGGEHRSKTMRARQETEPTVGALGLGPFPASFPP
jgi:hypothetical protein